jgi:tape measure domain-containing protein
LAISIELGTMWVTYKTKTDELIKGMDLSKSAMSSADKTAQASGKSIDSSFSQAGKSITDFASKTITGIDQAKARIVLVESRVREARAEIKKIENAADAGKSVTGLEEARAKLTLLEGEAQKAREGLQRLEREESRAGEGAHNLGQKVTVVSESLSGRLTGALNSARGGLLEFAANASMAGMGVVGLIEGIGSFAGSLLAPNASMEQTNVSFSAFIENADQLNTTLGELRDFGATTPYESAEINQSALSLLNMDEAANELRGDLGDIGAAVAKVGGSGQALEDVTGIIAQMGVKGKITTEEMQQLNERNIPAFKILAKSMGVPVATLQDMISNSELGRDKIDLLISSLGEFGGDAMVKQGQTFNGLLSTFKDNAGLALASFSGPLFNMAKGGLTELGNLVSSEAFQEFATTMGEKVGKALSDVGGFIQANVLPAFNDFSDFLKDNAGPAMDLVHQGIDGVKDVFEKVKGPAHDLFTAVSPLVSKFITFADKSGILKNGLSFLGTVIGKVVDGVALLANGLNRVIDFFTKTEVGAALLKATLIALSPVIAVGAVIAVVLLAGALWGAATAAWGLAMGVLGFTWPILAVIAIFAGIILLISHWGEVTSAVGSAVMWVWDKVSIGFKAALGGIGAAFSWVQGIIVGVWQYVSDRWGEAIDFFSGIGKGIVDIFHGVGDGIAGAVKGGINLLITGLNWFIDAINSVQIHVPEIGVGPVHTPAFDWNGLGLAHIAYLASGGIVAGGDEFIAGEAGPELIKAGRSGASVASNSSTMAMIMTAVLAALAQQQSQPVVIHVHNDQPPPDVILDGQRMTDALMERATRKLRGRGGRMAVI